MDYIDEFCDERQKSWCIHCTGLLAELKTTRDHVPSRTLLRKPYPENLPAIDVCASCNASFSADEEYLGVFLECVLAGSTQPGQLGKPSAGRALQRNLALRARIERSKTEYETRGGMTRLLWRPENKPLERVAVKNARGHVFYEYGEPMLRQPDSVWFAPLEVLTQQGRDEFESIPIADVWPEVGSRFITRMATGQDMSDGWIFVQDDKYRFAVAMGDSIFVRSVLSEYLATEVIWHHH